jgi:hypothetical protein
MSQMAYVPRRQGACHQMDLSWKFYLFKYITNDRPHLDLVVERFWFIFWPFCFLCCLLKLTKLKMKLLSLKMVVAPIIHKTSCNSFERCQCDWKDWKYTCDDEVFFLVWNFAQTWKITMKREYLIWFFWEKNNFTEIIFERWGLLLTKKSQGKIIIYFPTVQPSQGWFKS